ncbi:shikimate kinase [Jeotgalibacillus alimentarius]|uniref:Shikimate kinase n=1 Tax=Jeotgalibacillus alimentarius TaxID=135826 RepID=A0A0C2S3I5_9BACL|nr:shikimate kinase [Jeotgalibacillus alimentarius]KIL48509.1 shikimate kinase [Jeotgalibacillus alimentarius]
MKVYLIGFMGAGKSTVSRLLSSKTGEPYSDLDSRIEEKAGKKISTIFQEDGEASFREIEVSTLKAAEATIISTGGGILYFDETGQWMRQNGIVIYLHAPFKELYARIKGDQTRPVAAKPYKELEALFNKRNTAYKEVAHHVVSVSNRTPESTVKEIISIIQNS